MSIELGWGPHTLDGRVIDTSLTADEGRELVRLARDRQVLEVGAAFGYSACLMGPVAAHVWSVDPHLEYRPPGGIPGSYPTMRDNLAHFGLEDKVTMVLAWSQVALPLFVAMKLRFGFVFIDGDHHGPAVMHDLTYGRKLVAPGGALAFHDYDETNWPDVKPILDEAAPTWGKVSVIDTLWICEG